MADADSPLFRFQLWRAALPPGLRLLLTINAVTYLAAVAFGLLSLFGVPALRVFEWLILPADPATVFARPWTPFTYGFTNYYLGFFGLISFGFGFWWLNWMGREFEETYGAYRLVGLYVLSALGGAVLALLIGAAFSGADGAAFLRPYFGLWTPVTGILCAIATLHPDRGVGLFLLGVVPMKWLAVGFVVLSLVFSADLTVLGAALAGVGFARAHRSGVDLASWARPLFDRDRQRPAPRRDPAPTRSAPRKTAGRPAAPAAGGSRNIDEILDKILEEGYDSLTPDERKILDQASRD